MAQAAPHPNIRVAARLANAFALDLARLGSFGRDIVDTLLLTAITQANVALITRSPDLQRAYATLDQPPPDSLRRPVSVSAIANSLRIPFETARRRIAALTQIGIVATTPKGVIVPREALNSPAYREMAAAHVEMVRALYLRLRDVGLLDDLPPPAHPVLDPRAAPVRLVIRLSSDYLLRLTEPLNRHVGDLITGLILLEVVDANTEHFDDHEGGAGSWSAEAFVPDTLRRPVPALAVAQRLRLPPETVRRHIVRLADRGWVQREGKGYLIPARLLASERVVRYMLDNQAHLHRLFAALADFGVLALWDRELQELRGVA